MNVEKADYGTMQDFNTKLQIEGKTIDEVIDGTDKDGVSLLEKKFNCKKNCGSIEKISLSRYFLTRKIR